MGLWDTLQKISGEMDATALPHTALQLATDRLCETPVGIDVTPISEVNDRS